VLQGTSDNAEAITVTNNEIPVPGAEITFNSTTGAWSATVSLVSGMNFITVTASGTEGNQTVNAQTDVMVILDSDDPSVLIDDPSVSVAESTSNGIYIATSDNINLTGTASDDTRIQSVIWVRTAEGESPADASAAMSGESPSCMESQTVNWVASNIPLAEGKINTITVTVTDQFGKTVETTITIERQAGLHTEEGDNSDQGIAYTPQPVDQDGDGVEDSDDNCPQESNAEQTDTDGDGIGNACDDDDDNDGLPDDWEVAYNLNPLNNDSDGDGTLDGEENPDNDDYDNITEKVMGTHPLIANGFDLFLRDVTGTQDISDSWLPVYGDTVVIRAEWVGGGTPPDEVRFKLENTSAYPGRAINDPNPALMQTPGYPAWYYDNDQGIDNFHGPDFGLTVTPPTPNSLDPANTIHSFDQGQPDGIAVAGTEGVYTIYLQCWDYGARTKVMVSTEGISAIGELWVPQGSNAANRIAAAWDLDGDPGTPNLVDVSSLVATDDTDKIIFTDDNADRAVPYTASEGDDLTVFQEFRGLVCMQNEELNHIRLNPDRPDLFVRAIGFDDAEGDVYAPLSSSLPDDYYPFRIGLAFKNCGIDIHNTTGWGHDATEDGSFFIYFSKGNISTIDRKTVTGVGTDWLGSWPGNEWEFKLDGDPDEAWTPITAWQPEDTATSSPPMLYLDYDYPSNVEGEFDYLIRLPVPPINVLLIRFDKVTAKIKLDDDPEGYIYFRNATAPWPLGPGGTYGERHWAWTTKGYSRWNRTDSMYGAAIPMKIPLDHYFSDKPYQKGTVWDESQLEWRPAGNEDMELMPLSLGEDPSDSGSFIVVEVPITDPETGEVIGVEYVYIYDGSVPGDSPNEIWDGDKRLLNHDEWNVEEQGELSPFDVNNNRFIELPYVATPEEADNNEHDGFGNFYTKAWVLKHTISHEIGHALGGYEHSPIPYCLMYGYSPDWKRDHFLSDWFRSRLRMHNKIRQMPSEVF
jgi:hypothetical protein